MSRKAKASGKSNMVRPRKMITDPDKIKHEWGRLLAFVSWIFEYKRKPLPSVRITPLRKMFDAHSYINKIVFDVRIPAKGEGSSRFVVAHECAHILHGHTAFWYRIMATASIFIASAGALVIALATSGTEPLSAKIAIISTTIVLGGIVILATLRSRESMEEIADIEAMTLVQQAKEHGVFDYVPKEKVAINGESSWPDMREFVD